MKFLYAILTLCLYIIWVTLLNLTGWKILWIFFPIILWIGFYAGKKDKELEKKK